MDDFSRKKEHYRYNICWTRGCFIKETDGSVFLFSMGNFKKAIKLSDRQVQQSHICGYQKDIADCLFGKYGYRKYIGGKIGN